MFRSILAIFCLFSTCLHAQIQTPEQFLGYKLGEAFTLHHDLVRYIQHLASQSPRLKVQEYGKTYEKRALQVVFVSAPENLAKLEEIRQNNLKSAGLLAGQASGLQLPILWLGYTVHGNEPAGTEASMALLHQLASENSEKVQNWLKNMLIIIDPCQNPDGRERYAHWYQTVRNAQPDVNPDGWEHIEPWARGRFNHYLYDLNRDWAWQTQIETQKKTDLYRLWLPQVHIDVHEMGYEQSYFFGPPAHPIHPFASKWQREFAGTIAKENKQNFDSRQEPYFTKETYDFFYPSYGDTYPSLHGAIGLTYEQGGIRAGLGIVQSSGDTLYFSKRVQNHWEASQNTIAVTLREKEKLLQNFKQFFQENLEKPDSQYKTYVIKHTNSAGKLAKLTELLQRNYIQIGRAGKAGKATNFKGYAYHKHQETEFSLDEKDLILTAYQPQSRLLNVLLEPQAMLEDSLTYDLTAWALPFAYGLEAYALKEKILPTQSFEIKPLSPLPSPTAFAYIARWDDFEDVRFLTQALRAGFKIRQAVNPFESNALAYPAGTLVILRSDNKNTKDFDKKLFEVANQTQKNLIALPTGGVDKGNDLGSEYYEVVRLPKIAVVGGQGTENVEFGAVWHHFERDLGFPVTVLQHETLGNVDLTAYHILILPTGKYNAYSETLMEYAKQGGKIIALDNAMNFTAFKGTNSPMGQRILKMQEEKSETEQSPQAIERYENRERNMLTESTAGAICRVELDDTHPLAYGLGKTYYTLRLNQRHYPLLPKGHWNVGKFGTNSLVSGFVGKQMLAKIPNTFAFGVENAGKGKIIYLPETPVFRGFWYNGKMLFANAVFAVK